MTIRRLHFRLAIALVAAGAVLALPGTAAVAQSGSTVTLTSLQAGVLVQLNHVRADHGLQPLRLSAPLGEAAQQHSDEMGADGYFAHESRDGTSFSVRVGHWYPAAGHHSWSVGENLLWASPGVGAVGALRMWMNSPPHRANILDPRWREIGISAVHRAAAPGVYGGRPVTIITTDFGVRQ